MVTSSLSNNSFNERKFDKGHKNNSFYQTNSLGTLSSLASEQINIFSLERNTSIGNQKYSGKKLYSRVVKEVKYCEDYCKLFSSNCPFKGNPFPFKEVGQLLESALLKHASPEKEKRVNLWTTSESEGSDTGYSSRCSTPATSQQLSEQNCEKEKNFFNGIEERISSKDSIINEVCHLKKSPFPADESSSSFVSEDSYGKIGHEQLCYSPPLHSNSCFLSNSEDNHEKTLNPFYVYENSSQKQEHMPKCFIKTPHHNKINDTHIKKYNRKSNPKHNFDSNFYDNPYNSLNSNHRFNYQKQNYFNWNLPYRNKSYWIPNGVHPQSCHENQPNTRFNFKKKLFDPAGIFTFLKNNHDNKWQNDHRAEVSSPPPQLLTTSEWDSLSQQVWDIFVNNQQLESTFKKKMKLKDSISKVIWNVLPTCRLFVVGSSLSGFGANTSDVDMCLMVTTRDLDQRNEAQAVLRLLQRELNNCGFVEKMELIKAKVPILKFRDSYSSIDVDLNCNNSVGIRNTHLLNAYSQMDWRVRPLVLTVKLWAQHHHINNAKDMTISSYSLVLMVIHYLQCGVKPALLPCLQTLFPNKFNHMTHIFKIPVSERIPHFVSNNHQTLGELFLGFLDYYANRFMFFENSISVRTGGILPTDNCRYVRTKKNDCRMWKYLCIEEPFDLTNTARSVYDEIVFEKVKNVFKESHDLLKENKNLNSIFQKKNKR